MGRTLVIVESPNKCKTIQGYLGKDFVVKASAGHIRDMPEREMGVEAPDYRPKYEVTDRAKRTVKELKELAKEAPEVILATDADREGEAIAWHLKDALGLKDPTRITFNEITEPAVKAALKAKRKIDNNLVAAQEARRVLDRLVGYRVSPALSDIAGDRLSAGRVQTPAVRLIVEREEAIESFKSVDHFGVELVFSANTPDQWAATWNFKPLLSPDVEQPYWLDKAFAEKVAKVRAVKVAKVEQKRRQQQAKAPFSTSTLQQVGASRLKMKTKAVMEAAQRLFEGVGGDHGWITYHRTDSVNMSDEGAGMVWELLKAKGLGDYIPEKKNTWKEKGDTQGAHEAIRPTDFTVESLDGIEGVGKDEARLYRLIWERAVASQMAAKVDDVTTVDLEAVDEVDGRAVVFRASGAVPVFDGWARIAALAKDNEDDEDEEGGKVLPPLSEGQALTADDGRAVAKKTEPPARYTEATLVKALEDNGIGRPATYASIIDTVIHRRAYAVPDKKGRLIPSKVARDQVVGVLRGRFAFADVEYTRDVEKILDDIAEGKAKYKAVVTAIDAQLSQELAKLETAGLIVIHNCPNCGKRLYRREGKSGHFWACSGYPECKTTLPDENGKPGAAPEAYSGPTYPCPACGKDMVPKRSGDKVFWGCTGYPECKTALPDDGGKPAAAHECPKCKAVLKQLVASKGPTKGKPFWLCPNRDCDFKAADAGGKPVLKG